MVVRGVRMWDGERSERVGVVRSERVGGSEERDGMG